MAAKARSSTEILIPNKKHYYGHTNNSTRTSSVDQESSKNIWVKAEQVNKSQRISTSGGSKLAEVIYYISSPNGSLQHPHFMEVTLPHSSHELYFKDVLNRLNELRGEGMASMYSWSSKRSYKNGYVWQDLSENDIINPTNGKDEYIIKGSELIQHSSSSTETAASQNMPEKCAEGRKITASPAKIMKRRNQSWSSFDNPPTNTENKVYKCESSRGFSGVVSAKENVLEICGEDVSPVASHCESEVLEGVSGCSEVDYRSGDRTVKNLRGRMKVTKMLMQFIRCGSVPMKGL
ncbi:protein SOSEKI 5-like [Apium graveolens]|uniref:protein SOSEKI 5-like n=1 Tax=Apium graveolens TaxID=4045 RepID=UPI003D7A80FC